MATDLTIKIDLPKTKPNSSCNCAQQCLWYEAPATSSNACINRTSLVCQKYCEEVFGHGNNRESNVGH
jgi:hypothetical protein